MEYMIAPLKKYADFQGRARRKEFWMYVLFLFIVGLLVGAVGGVASGGDPTNPLPLSLTGIFWLATIIPNLAVAVRRLHDTDRSGWWILIGLIPVVGFIVLIVFYASAGTPGPNKFGPDPKAGEALA